MKQKHIITFFKIQVMMVVLGSTIFMGCSRQSEAPTHVSTTEEITVEATVVAVDIDTREITLVRADGTKATTIAGPDIQNLDQINIGDAISARYHITLSARLLAADEPDTPLTKNALVTAGSKDSSPFRGIGGSGIVSMTVQGVDAEKSAVELIDQEGTVHSITAAKKDGKRFVAGLKKGDRIELTYGETLAVALEKDK